MSDPSFDRALGAAARRGRDAGTCPDAEQLAAFVDGVLPRAEHDAIEAHAADCMRCTEHLALLLPIAEPKPASRGERPLLVRWGWLVPVATAVIVAAIWVRLPERELQDAVTVDGTPAPAERVAEPAEAPEAPVTGPDAPEKAAAAPGDTAAKTVEPRRRRQTPEAQREAKPSAPRTSAAAPPADAPPSGALAESVTVADAADQANAPPPAGPAPSAQAGRAARPELFRFEAAPEPVEVDAGPIRYRATGSRLERSRDSGTTWQVVEPDAGAPFTATGCAPDGICWFGTAAGTVFRLAAGAATRLELPIRAAVVSVTASASGDVEVALASGERFRTTDAGARWTPVP